MIRFLNMTEKENKHLKAEVNLIGSIGRGEMAEIIYTDGETAERRAKNLKQKLKGTEMAVKAEAYGNTVVVTRL